MQWVLVSAAVLAGTTTWLALTARRWWLRAELHELRRMPCPESGKDVECVLVRDAATGRWCSIVRCSACPGRGAPTCDRRCVEVLNRGILLGKASPPS